MEKLLKTGKTKAIGVSNYSVKYLEELLPHCEVVPAANQIENREPSFEHPVSLGKVLSFLRSMATPARDL